jgi:hypothetical protein
MKQFHISDVLSVTTPLLLSSRHMEGVYDILNWLTGDSLYTHQLPRAEREVRPWMRTQFPDLMDDSPRMAELLTEFRKDIESAHDRVRFCANFVERVRITFALPEYLPVYEMAADMHTTINPVEELGAMVGDDKVIVVSPDNLA